MDKPIYQIRFDSMPGPHKGDATFVETETPDGRGVGSPQFEWKDDEPDSLLMVYLPPHVKVELTRLQARVEKADALKKAAELVHEQCNVSGANVSHHAWIDLDDALRAYEATKEDGHENG